MNYLIIGGTGTLGTELVRQLSDDRTAKITIYSRGELKQQQLKRDFPHVRCVIGDVRDREALKQAIQGQEAVFHMAAIKHIDVAEQNPLEAVKTNFLGTVNVAEEAMAAGCNWVVFSNTDKAVLPITTYGYTKALAQNYVLSLNLSGSKTRFSAFSWGNVLASRGSVIPSFVKSLKDNRSICLTDMRMSRFWITIEAAAAFMLQNFKTAPLDKAMIPPIKGASVVRVAETVAKVMNIKDYDVSIIGLRGTEKLYEVLESTHGGCFRSDQCEQYTDTELFDLLEPSVIAGLA